MRFEVRSPPIGLETSWPSWRERCDQRLALDTLTPKRVAARWQEAPATTAAPTRSRGSADRDQGMSKLLHPPTR